MNSLTIFVDHNSDDQQPSFRSKKNPRTEEGSETGHNGSSKTEGTVRASIKVEELDRNDLASVKTQK